MLLAGALFALFVMGFWLYCLTDAILTPAPECRGLSKPAWIAVIAVTFIGGALAWLIVRQPARQSSRPFTPVPRWDLDRLDDEGALRIQRRTDEPDAVTLPPADWTGRAAMPSAPKGPDDDPEFLSALDRAIDGNSPDGGEAF
jgi:peptidoglycan/LPS O-acetylase OafA/YrhL